MDPATPLPPYTPPTNGSSGIAGQSGMSNPPVLPPNLTSSQTPPPIVPGQPYLNSAVPPAAPAMPMSPASPGALTFENGGAPALSSLGPDPVLPPAYGNSMAAPVSGAAGPVTSDIKHELVEQLRKANNVLVTVSSNPSVDQLAAAIGITLVLNKLDKHATAVYSGETPSVLEFLQPEKTIEKNTDSLRDFIIALDKAKADKLRYKVEDKFVKIFITPYHTSLSENDLEFSQGDFNVDVVLALGVHQREELDQAITAHGRILHDAVTVSINNKQPSDLGAFNWFQTEASSLSEMLVSLVEPLQGDKAILDEQIATAFLTGVVAETERFSNSKTTPYTMNIAATLMKAGANQQLVSSKLQAPEPKPQPKSAEKPTAQQPAGDGTMPIPTASNDGSLSIEHKKKDDDESKPTKTLQDLEKENNGGEDGDEESDLAKIHIDEQGKLLPADGKSANQPDQPAPSSNMVMQPPSMGGAMSSTGTQADDAVQPAVDTPATDQTSLQHARTVKPLTEEEKTQTLTEIEKSVDSSHVNALDAPVPDADIARQAVDQAHAAAPSRLEPVQALNAQPVELNSAPAGLTPDLTTEEVFPTQLVGPDKGLPPDPTAGAADPSAPPPVPPPMMPTP